MGDVLSHYGMIISETFEVVKVYLTFLTNICNISFIFGI